ncbi:androgen-induced gene 1 protein-like [Montipora capricornis]|uniref:androgen-induced gene 1 protein-like n=1 Tax=Montipora capricornis TaxID=246305 RepID=UPI0035F1E5D1
MAGLHGRLIFYYLCFLVHLIGLTYHLSEINFESHQTYGGRFKFLTFINMLLQFVYFNMAAVTGFHELLKKRKSEVFASVCDFTFACFVFPIALTVSILFWGLYAADPHSCQTPEEAKFIPAWLNHYMHSFPFVTAMCELWLIEHKYPPRTKGLLSVLAFGVAYTAWVLWVAFASDIWVYPFLEKMSWTAIAAFFTCALSFSSLLYLFGEGIAIRRWQQEASLEKKNL